MKKVLSSLLACLLLLGVVPVGLISLHTPAAAEGEVLKISPIYDTYVHQDYKTKTGIALEPSSDDVMRATEIGAGQETYLQFQLESILGKSDDEIASASLRLVALDSDNAAVPVTMQFFDNNDWDEGITYARKPAGNGTDLGSVTMQANAPAVYEIDLTDALKQWVKDEVQTVSLRLTAEPDTDGTVSIGSTRNSDPAYRPYLKVITGDASDPEPDTIQKAVTEVAVSISNENSEETGNDYTQRTGTLSSGGGHEAFLKFRLQRANIQGAVVSAKVRLKATGTAPFFVYTMQNDSWDGGVTYQNRPQGPETLVYQGSGSSVPVEIDITDAVSDAVEQGLDTICLHIIGNDASVPVTLTAAGQTATPSLSIRVSDDPNVIAVREAAVNLLGANANTDSILTDLTRSYTAENGVRATVDWTVRDTTFAEEKGSYENTNYISNAGEVTRPKWFEGTKTFHAEASIKSGSAVLTREMDLTLPAEAVPSYDTYHFENYIIIGDEKSEAAQEFEIIHGSSPKYTFVNLETYSYRTLKKDGAMVLNLRCEPDTVNYLTIKLRGSDTGDGTLLVSNAMAGTAYGPAQEETPQTEWHVLDRLSTIPQSEDGFVYVTYALPEDYTRGRDFVSLRLYSRGGYSRSDTPVLLEQTAESRGIYAAYLTQQPAFDPTAFDTARTSSATAEEDDRVRKYQLGDASDMEKQRGILRAAVKTAVEDFMSWQVYGAGAYPAAMEGMQTRSTAWASEGNTDAAFWKAAYYHSSNGMVQKGFAPLAYLELFAYAYLDAQSLGFTNAQRAKLLDRIAVGIDFLCRAQGENGGFSSVSNSWIGGPDRKPASGMLQSGYGLRSVGKAIQLIYPDLAANGLMQERIDADADGVTDSSRQTAWASMLLTARDFLANTMAAGRDEAANMATLLQFDRALSAMGSPAALQPAEAKVYIDRGLQAVVSEKGALFDGYQAARGGYGGTSLNDVSALIELAATHYFANDTAQQSQYIQLLQTVYETAGYFYYISNAQDGQPAVYAENISGDAAAQLSDIGQYPFDLYAAVTLKIPAAQRVLSAYLGHGRAESDSAHLAAGEPYYEAYMLDLLHLYHGFDAAVAAASSDDAERPFLMDDTTVDTFAWADAETKQAVIKNSLDHLYVSLITAGNTEDKQIRIHHTTPHSDQHVYLQPEWQGALLTVSYGDYAVIMNTGTDSAALPQPEESGIYKDLISGEYYFFRREGETLDDSVLPKGCLPKDGLQASLAGSESVVLVQLSGTLSQFDWKVSELNGVNISDISISQTPASIETVTIKAVGDTAQYTAGQVTVLCGVYNGEVAVDFVSHTVAVNPAAEDSYTIDLGTHPLNIQPGQQLKIYIWEGLDNAYHLPPKLTLP